MQLYLVLLQIDADKRQNRQNDVVDVERNRSSVSFLNIARILLMTSLAR